MPRSSLLAVRLACGTPLLLLAGATPPMPLTPGSWTFTNVPVSASLDGRVLHDLPVGDITSETGCLTPALAAQPARWLARDLLHDCSLDRTEMADGRITIEGHCPSRGAGFAPGTLAIAGRYTATSYDVTFKTLSPDENGTMGFDGRMTGHRTGVCPTGSH